eukprot:1158515-Pelagomonas_calceolata.AAC.7
MPAAKGRPAPTCTRSRCVSLVFSASTGCSSFSSVCMRSTTMLVSCSLARPFNSRSRAMAISCTCTSMQGISGTGDVDHAAWPSLAHAHWCRVLAVLVMLVARHGHLKRTHTNTA